MYCHKCGAEALEGAKFCSRCGTQTVPVKISIPSKGIEKASVIDASYDVENTARSGEFLGGNHRPWRRFFARTVDILTSGLVTGMLFIFLFSFALAKVSPEAVNAIIPAFDNQLFAGIIIYLAWLPVEALLISTTGMTPAKWIYGISVLDKSGLKLSYASALKRSCLVFFQGEGAGLPIVTFFTRYFAYKRLTTTGTTLWDTAVGSVVTHKTWGIGRWVASILSLVFALMVIGLLQNMPT